MLGKSWLARLCRAAAAFALLFVGLAVRTSAQTGGSFDWRHAGTIFDAFSLDGDEIWTVEDGGRIRHRDAAGNWTFQTTGFITQNLLYRAQFLSGGQIGWAVGLDGRYLWTLNGGSQWHDYQIGNSATELWDVAFTDGNHGWLIEKHGLLRTDTGFSGPSNWNAPVLLLDAGGNQISTSTLQKYEFYSLDIVGAADISMPGGGTYLGLMCAMPGLIFRSTDGVVWQVVFDVRNLCSTNLLPDCARGICSQPPPLTGFQPWDVEISRNNSQPLALMVGGVGNGCGMAFRSTDYGITWTVEPHECTCQGTGCRNCLTDSLYNDNLSTNTDTWRYQYMNTLYSVSIFDADNSAIAGGYGGQHLVRNASTHIWEDRSSISTDIVHAIGAVTTPMYATAASAGTGTTGHGMMAGTGGVIQRTTNGGQTWSTEVAGDAWRVRDLCFINSTTGWIVGQWFRIAKSTDGGVSWDYSQNQVTPEPIIGGGNFNSIAMATSGDQGVAVGQRDNTLGATYPDRPKIRRLVSQTQGRTWLDPLTYSDDPSTGQGSHNKELREVVWAGGSDFWAAGQAGLIYSSNDSGQNWNQRIPPGYSGWPAMQQLDFQGIAFADATHGILVGKDTSTGNGFAFAYVGGSNPTWTSLWTQDPAVKLLSDVEIAPGAAVAYATGVKIVSGAEVGVMLTSTASGGSFSSFVIDPSVPTIPSCTIGGDLDSVPVLNRVRVAPGGEVWVAGECGRVWNFFPASGNGSWYARKSQTDAHIRGLSFPAALNGFGVGYRASTQAYCVIGYQ